ncbi:hypothetical protein BCR44DRAFT_1177421 [Catenaria anguillulae PL171]|uniref:Atos-like conserved domain-containing protein n=1 Tax=Catenaria anguillulae PL171 TaxID=765915 RepID=A0A1Y2HJX9_9FUNG|nr:hypothetical protein BCR44DRAFT_1177421 [Catenaria anguillulae PL171]
MTTSSPSKFVGSYEESLLSRRLSARRSKPISFNATIGVIGHGKCKPALKCPPHMAVSFAAHYYNFEDDDFLGGGSPVPSASFNPSPPSPTHAPHPSIPSGLRPALGWFAAPSTASTVAPSHSPTLPASAPTWTPYVGVIDLSLLKTSSVSTESLPEPATDPSMDPPKPNKEGVVGGYRIPPRGQLQIVIKNPHQSALKVFLVPYDLSKMPKGTKTAMRHKQYARPVDDQPQPADSGAPPTPRKRSLSHRSLRYALHIPIVCTARGRHYLAGSGGMRVVFSGKSPESHERLDAVTELAGGFTPWVPAVTGGKSAKAKDTIQAPNVDQAAAVSEESPTSPLFVPESHVHNSSPPFIR